MTTTIEAGQSLVLKTSDTKSVGRLIEQAIKSYGSGHKAIHDAACAALFWVFEHGDTRPLNSLYSGLVKVGRLKDDTGFRVWVGHHGQYAIENDAGQIEAKRLLTFKKDEGFQIVKGISENMRKGQVGVLDLQATTPFYTFQKPAAASDNKDAFMEMLAKLSKLQESVDKKAKEHDFAVPAGIASALQDVTVQVSRIMDAVKAQAKMAANAAVKAAAGNAQPKDKAAPSMSAPDC